MVETPSETERVIILTLEERDVSTRLEVKQGNKCMVRKKAISVCPLRLVARYRSEIILIPEREREDNGLTKGVLYSVG